MKLEKLFIRQNRWEMTKWMIKNRNSYSENYKIFKKYLFLSFFGVIMGLSGVLIMILFLTNLFLNFLTLTLWLGLLVGGLIIVIIGIKMQLPILQEILLSYVKDQSIQINFNINGWIYEKKYHSIKSYKHGLIVSIILYFPLALFTIIITSSWIDFVTILFVSYALYGFIFLTNLPLLFFPVDKYVYPYCNFPLTLFYGLLITITLVINFGNEGFYFLIIVIITIYLFIFWYIGKKLLIIGEDDIRELLLSDIKNFLNGENEIIIKYWNWIQSRPYLIKDLIQSDNLNDIELIENKIIKKKKI